MLNKLYEQGKDLHVANYMAYGKTADHKLYADATFKETVTKEEIEDYCRHHCTYRRSAAGSDQPDAERHGQEPAAHREHHCGTAGDGWHHDHRGTGRMVEEQLVHQGSHCGRQGVRPPEGEEREVKMIFRAGQEWKM